MGLKILQFIADDTFVFVNPMTMSRKEDLRNALIAILSRAPSPSASSAAMPVALECYTQCGVQPGNEGWIMKIIQLLQHSIQNQMVIYKFLQEITFHSSTI